MALVGTSPYPPIYSSHPSIAREIIFLPFHLYSPRGTVSGTELVPHGTKLYQIQWPGFDTASVAISLGQQATPRPVSHFRLTSLPVSSRFHQYHAFVLRFRHDFALPNRDNGLFV
uniref:Uncharacterized protein n=1 Tax=Oryza rufipogon TaxID=4529 RepID=A0A0E0R1Q1_ORYRU